MIIDTNKSPDSHRKIAFKAAPLPQKEFVQPVKKMLNEADTIYVTFHRNADDDSLGSAVAAAKAWGANGKNVNIIAVGHLPERIMKIVKEAGIKILKPEQVKIKNKDVLFITDLNEDIRLPDSVRGLIAKYNKSLLAGKGKLGKFLNILKKRFFKLIRSITGKRKFEPEQIVLIDHHAKGSEKTLIQSNWSYIDKNAKASSELMYQLVNDSNLQNNPKDSEYLASLYYGFMDDLIKSGNVEVIENDGKVRLKASKTIPAETRKELATLTVELKTALKNEGIPEKMKEINNSFGFFNNLTPELRKFWDGLSDRVQYKFNGKAAMIDIPPDDPEWKALGQDNEGTSNVMKRFARELLKDNPELKAVIRLYRGTRIEKEPWRERQHISILSREGSGIALDMAKWIEAYAEKNNKSLLKKYRKQMLTEQSSLIKKLIAYIKYKNATMAAGGHPDRIGGSFPVQLYDDLNNATLSYPGLG